MIMKKKPMKYFVVRKSYLYLLCVFFLIKMFNILKIKQVDAFTDSALKGNPAVVCFLDDESKRDDAWL